MLKLKELFVDLILRELDALTTDETLHLNLSRISPVFFAN